MKKILIYGGGNMGSAIAKAILNKKLFSLEQVTIIEKDHSRREFLKNCFSCDIFEKKQPEKNSIVLLAVKPNTANLLMEEIQEKIDTSHLIISIMAGIQINTMEEKFPNAKIIRVMPNLPVQIGLGMCAYYGNSFVTKTDYEILENLCNSMGQSMKVSKEEMIDAATAISGSGPAYLFFLAETLQSSAMSFGFTKEEATLLTEQTLYSASTLLKKSNKDAQTLRKEVTSPKGTTEAALHVFEHEKCKDILQKGYLAAYQRAKELSDHL